MAGTENARGQYVKVYAQYLTSADTGGSNGSAGAAGTLGAAGVAGTHSTLNPANANDLNFSDYVELKGQSGTAGTGLGATAGGASSAYIRLNFSGAVTPLSGTPVIIKLQAVNNSGVLAINPLTQVSIQAYNGVTPVGSSSLVSALTLRNTDEYIFMPSGACNSIRITTTTAGSNLLGAAATTSAYVYYAYIFDPACSPANYTATSVTGLLTLGGGVNNPVNAIDADAVTYSAFSVGIGLGTTLHQDVYFSNLSASTDAATVMLSMPPSLLSAGLLGSTSIIAYNGNTQVGSTTFSALLNGTDLLGLLQAGNVATISYAPGAAFNRVEVTMSSLAGVATSLNLYEVQRTPPRPAFTLPKNDTVYVCSGSTAVLAADAPAAGNELRWYATATPANTTVLYTGNTYTLPFASAQDTVFYVAVGKTGCSASSERVPVRVLVRPLPGITFNSSLYICQQRTSVLLLYSGAINNPAQYSIAWGTTAVSAGFQAVSLSTLPASPLTIAVPVAASPQAYTGTLTLTGTNTCTRSYGFTVTIQATPHPPPPVTSFQ